MRKLDRPQQPECLASNATHWTDRFITARQQNPKHPFRWPNQDCYQVIRQCLSEMTQAHCAFCDGLIGIESRETVEHFRPKSQNRFQSLAYQWDNLFPCCDMCQAQKREQFEHGLLKPDEADYVFAHYFVVNYKTGAIEPSPHAELSMQERAEITQRIYGLNLPIRNKARIREWERFCRDPAPLLDDYNYLFFMEKIPTYPTKNTSPHRHT